eukprot:gnl/Hemi2/19984_TR6632_c0_g2_i2.p1 gnl/Hemi2/19984_TR6632_c0_g2~~gnl/Hemi2/19984_TR6632_c0_g2_i2.p1  ORF type:complete len:189 (-),score=71.97 gnl/Hemi2/19984_TR6632_c0_g2_i2:157-681(-)
MEAHSLLKRKNKYYVRSFGTNTHVKIPGPTSYQPNVYEFGTPYTAIKEDLARKDLDLYTRIGLLSLLERNGETKFAPEQWQQSPERFDLVVTFDEKCFDIVVEDLQSRGSMSGNPVHVINLETKDNAEDALVSSHLLAHFLLALERSADWQSDVSVVLAEFEDQRDILHTVMFY